MYKVFHFLSSPYTSQHAHVRLLRVTLAAQAVTHAAKSFTHFYSPIVHGHFVEELGQHEMPYNYWLDHCFCMLRKAASVKVLTIPGWANSKGVEREIEEAQRNHIPVEYIGVAEYCNIEAAATLLDMSGADAVKELLKNAVRHPD